MLSSRNQMVKSLLVSLPLIKIRAKEGLYANVFWLVSNLGDSFDFISSESFIESSNSFKKIGGSLAYPYFRKSPLAFVLSFLK
jgi:hypothetical protein